MAAQFPTLSSQKPNIRILNRIRLGEFVTKVPLPHTDLREGEWLIPAATTGWRRALTADKDATIKACFPVIGKPSEHMNAALRTSARGTQGAVPVYLGTLPLVVDTLIYDADPANTYAVGGIVHIKTITISEVNYAGLVPAAAVGIPAGRILRAPSTSNGGWLRALITFC